MKFIQFESDGLTDYGIKQNMKHAIFFFFRRIKKIYNVLIVQSKPESKDILFIL